MEKSKIDQRAVKIAMDRLAREIKLKTGIAPDLYLAGYNEAICDFIWDYTRTPLKLLQQDALVDESIKQQEVKQ